MICGCQIPKNDRAKEYLPGQQNMGLISQWGSVCGLFSWSPIRVEIFLFFCPGDPGRVMVVGPSDRDLGRTSRRRRQRAQAIRGDVEGKDVRNSTAPTAEHVAWTRGQWVVCNFVIKRKISLTLVYPHHPSPLAQYSLLFKNSGSSR